MTNAVGMPKTTQSVGQLHMDWLREAFADGQRARGVVEELVRTARGPYQVDDRVMADLDATTWSAAKEIEATPRPTPPSAAESSST